MYTPIGLRGIRRRGLGQVETSTTVLNYPGMPDLNPMIETPLTASQLASLSAANAAFFNQPADGTVTSWLSANSGLVAIGAGVVLLLVVLTGGRRR